MEHSAGEFITLLFIAALVAAAYYRAPWKPSTTAFGTACWATDRVLRLAGMLAGRGLILGRTVGGSLIRLPHYTHILLVGATGSGKGVSIIIPQLLSYRGSLICFDTKGDLFETTAKRRAAMGQRILRLAPFNKGSDTLNPLDAIPRDSTTLVDQARAMAESLVVRQGTELDPHWNDKAVQVIAAILVLVLLRFEGEERSLNTVQEIASDEKLLASAADKLREIGGVPARLGSQLGTLFWDFGGITVAFTREGASVMSTVQRHLSFLDSDLVAASVARSTFDVADLLKPGTTLFLQIPPDQLEAQRGLLRCWLSTLIRVIGKEGNEQNAEVLALIDEASALGNLGVIEEALVRGRSAGVRLLLAYQSDSQVRAAFKDKPTLIYDNCSVQLYLGVTSIESAERLSKTLGEWTQVVESASENESTTRQGGGFFDSPGNGMQTSRTLNWSRSFQPSGRALLKPEELLTLSRNYMIALIAGMPPILVRRIKWFTDPMFRYVTSAPSLLWWVLMAGVTALLGRALLSGR